MASLQTAFHTLDEEIKMTSRRVNALEYVLIPRIEEIIHYITQAAWGVNVWRLTEEMDEQAREEFFRVKKARVKLRLLVMLVFSCRHGIWTVLYSSLSHPGDFGLGRSLKRRSRRCKKRRQVAKEKRK